MKTILTALSILLIAATSRCFALYNVAEISKEEAKEMGVTIRTAKNGDAGIRVWMEFKTAGKLKEFSHVEVRIGQGKSRIMSAPLRESHPSPGSVAVQFSADPAYLARSMLLIYVDDAPRGGTVYQFNVKDFIGPEEAK